MIFPLSIAVRTAEDRLRSSFLQRPLVELRGPERPPHKQGAPPQQRQVRAACQGRAGRAPRPRRPRLQRPKRHRLLSALLQRSQARLPGMVARWL